MPNCELCGEPMPPGEEVFKYHGYSGPCPKPPLPPSTDEVLMEKNVEALRQTSQPPQALRVSAEHYLWLVDRGNGKK